MTALARRLARCAGPDGVFRVLALDHRDSLRVLLDPANPATVDRDSIKRLKRRILEAVDGATGVMLEPEYSLELMREVGDELGVIASLESQGYLTDATVTHTTLMASWSPTQALESGASATKFLGLVDPGDPDAVTAQLETARIAVELSHEIEMPIFLEPLWRSSLDPDAVIRAAEKFGPLNADVLKMPFPASEDAPSTWPTACRTLTEVCGNAPWVLLSAGTDLEIFASMLHVAMANGCAGFMAGRAVWGEAAARLLDDPESIESIRKRFSRLLEVTG